LCVLRLSDRCFANTKPWLTPLEPSRASHQLAPGFVSPAPAPGRPQHLEPACRSCSLTSPHITTLTLLTSTAFSIPRLKRWASCSVDVAVVALSRFATDNHTPPTDLAISQGNCPTSDGHFLLDFIKHISTSSQLEIQLAAAPYNIDASYTFLTTKPFASISFIRLWDPPGAFCKTHRTISPLPCFETSNRRSLNILSTAESLSQLRCLGSWRGKKE
jgi:hypothetical protein